MALTNSLFGSEASTELLQSLRLQNILSFGDLQEIKLTCLNVLVGPNGSGKSNLIESINFLRSSPEDFALPVREGGGVSEWIHKVPKGAKGRKTSVTAGLHYLNGIVNHLIGFESGSAGFSLVAEGISSTDLEGGGSFQHQKVGSDMHLHGESKTGMREARSVAPDRNSSILKSYRDPGMFPELSFLVEFYERIRIYRGWSFGPDSPLRFPQRADNRTDYLEEDFSNLALLLGRFRLLPDIRDRLIEKLRDFLPGATGYEAVVEGGSIQLFVQEGRVITPAVRLSDGTLKYLCLIAVLLQPDPPPLVCIEEPEIGLHPDVLPGLAELLIEASDRMQLIVTTHSDILVDALSDLPEVIIVCEKTNGDTMMKRLEAEELKPWLEAYKLGRLWLKGQIGGTRW
ncbi:MAG TPA: AAA family ATPase [Fimbriimonadaceae bacterium]|jgi:predicted ATPase